MTSLKKGDSAICKSYSGPEFSVIIKNVTTEENGAVYECLRDGVWANDEGTPNFIISSSYIFDPVDLKQTFLTGGKGVFRLEYRAPELDDDEKRALWEFQIKKQDDAIAAMRAKYGHITKGMTVKWREYNSWTGQVAFECIGKIMYIKHNLSCYIICTDGVTRAPYISELTVVEDALSADSPETAM
jgi:hypothetical protein